MIRHLLAFAILFAATGCLGDDASAPDVAAPAPPAAVTVAKAQTPDANVAAPVDAGVAAPEVDAKPYDCADYCPITPLSECTNCAAVCPDATVFQCPACPDAALMCGDRGICEMAPKCQDACREDGDSVECSGQGNVCRCHESTGGEFTCWVAP